MHKRFLYGLYLEIAETTFFLPIKQRKLDQFSELSYFRSSSNPKTVVSPCLAAWGPPYQFIRFKSKNENAFLSVVQ